MPGIDRIICAKLLGVWLQDVWVQGNTAITSWKFVISGYLLNLLKKQGLPQLQLQTVLRTILISRLLYAAPAWRGFARAADIDCIQCMLVEAKRWQLVWRDYKFMDMLNDCDIALYKAACNTNHCLNHLFKPKQRFMIWYYDDEVTIIRCRSLSFRPPRTHLLIVLCLLLYKWHNVLVYIVKFKCYVNRIGECGWAFVSVNKRCTYLRTWMEWQWSKSKACEGRVKLEWKKSEVSENEWSERKKSGVRVKEE